MTRPQHIATRLRSLQAVLFDLDGTLIDTIPHIRASFRHATTEVLGAPLDDAVLLENVGMPLAQQMRQMAGDEETAERLLAAYRAFNHATHDEMARLFPGTLEALSGLEACGRPLAVVTSKSALMAKRGIELFGLGGYFGAVVTADDTERHKPDPAPVLLATELLGVDAARCLYVGDSPHDIESGKAAGMLTAAATWGVASRERLAAAAPDVVLDDLRDVVALACDGDAR